MEDLPLAVEDWSIREMPLQWNGHSEIHRS